MLFDYVIIGGGVQGLLLAYELCKANPNISINILEETSLLGGLLTQHVVSEECLEDFYHHLLPTDEELIKLLQELGLADRLIWYPASMAMYDNGSYCNFNTIGDLLKYSHTSFCGRLGIGYCLFRILMARKCQHGVAADVVRKWSGKRGFSALWHPLLYGKFHNYSDEVAFSWLAYRIKTRGKGPRSRRGKLGYLRGGMGQIIERLVEKLQELRVVFTLNTSCLGLRKSDLGWQVITKDQSYMATNVIITAPNQVVGQWLNNGGTKKWCDATKYLGAICVTWRSCESLFPAYWNNILDREIPFVVAVEHTRLVPKEWYQNYHIGYLGAYLPQDSYLLTNDKKYIYSEFYRAISKLTKHADMVEIVNIACSKYAQHVVNFDFLNSMPKSFEIEKNLYLTNYSMIYPEDRGVNYAVIQSKKILKQLLC